MSLVHTGSMATPNLHHVSHRILGGAKKGLAVLTLVNLLNYLDRYVVSALVETLRKSELALTDTQSGLLMTGFLIIYMLTAPVFGSLGDRRSRPRLLALGVALWSLATALGAFTHIFLTLFLARAVVGIGEAAYGTIAPALIADYFPPLARGRAFALFFSAIPVGAALGYMAGGFINEQYGWRAAFLLAGIPGLLLATLCLLVDDPPRGIQERLASAPMEEHKKTRRVTLAAIRMDYSALLRNQTLLLSLAGYAAYTFGIGGLAFWMPAFLERVRGLPKQDASIMFGAVVVATGLVGTFAGGWIADWLQKRTSRADLLVCGIATLLGFPFAVMTVTSSQPIVYQVSMIMAELLFFASTGPINSTIINVVEPRHRATAVALCTFVIHVVGDVPSPPLIGWISDRSSLQQGVLLVPVAMLVSGIIWTYAAWKLPIARLQPCSSAQDQ